MKGDRDEGEDIGEDKGMGEAERRNTHESTSRGEGGRESALPACDRLTTRRWKQRQQLVRRPPQISAGPAPARCTQCSHPARVRACAGEDKG